jgi:hypothetical protein
MNKIIMIMNAAWIHVDGFWRINNYAVFFYHQGLEKSECVRAKMRNMIKRVTSASFCLALHGHACLCFAFLLSSSN